MYLVSGRVTHEGTWTLMVCNTLEKAQTWIKTGGKDLIKEGYWYDEFRIDHLVPGKAPIRVESHPTVSEKQ
jgi:hypothetical protein